MLVAVIILQNLVAAIYAIYNRKVAEDSRDLFWHQTAAVFAILYACGLLYALPRHAVDFAAGFDNIGLILINGFCFGIGTGIAYLAFRDQDAAVANTNLLWRIPVASLLAVLILDQPLTITNIVGSLVIIFSVVVASVSTVTKASNWRPSKATIYALVAGSLFGVGIVTEKMTLNAMNVDTFLVMSWPSELIWLLIPTFLNVKLWKKVAKPKVLKPTIIMGLLRFAAGYMFIWALANAANTTLITSSGGLQTVLTVILAAVLLNETQHLWYKFAAAVISAIGIGILFL